MATALLFSFYMVTRAMGYNMPVDMFVGYSMVMIFAVVMDIVSLPEGKGSSHINKDLSLPGPKK